MIDQIPTLGSADPTDEVIYSRKSSSAVSNCILL